MAYILQEDVVFYSCTCGLLKPISKLYFCRHCLQMRCGFCVCHEVDSHFCGKCAENIPSSEARLKKNRCSSCYDCPCCQHQLSIRMASSSSSSVAAAAAAPASPVTEAKETKATPRKVYYLACSFCRWNTRDVGIPDQSVASGGWPERENVHANRLLTIQEKYKALVLWDKQQKLDKEKKKHIQRSKYITMTDKTGLTAAMIRKRVGLPDLPPMLPKTLNVKEVPAAQAREDVDQLPADIFTRPLNLDEVSTLEQRLLQPEWQPDSVNLLFPLHKQLSVKRSLRCRRCEHNVSKPEFNPNSIKFKIQLFAYYHIPEVRIVTVEPLRAGHESELIVKLCNPTQHQTAVSLLPLAEQDLLAVLEEDENAGENIIDKQEQTESLSSIHSSTTTSALVRQSSISVKPRALDVRLMGDVHVPGADVSIVLPPRDDAAEYDDSADTHTAQDDPKLVIWRKSNKVALKLKIIPKADCNIGEQVTVGFIMQHIYNNTITTIENKEPQKCEHRVKVFLSLGKTVGFH